MTQTDTPAMHNGNGTHAHSNGFKCTPEADKDYKHPMEIEDFRKRGYEMVDWICNYYATVGEMPVRSLVQPGYLAPQMPTEAPEEGESFDAIMRDVDTKVMPGMTHWQSPSFFAYFPANSSFPALLGEMMSGALNMIGFSWIGSPAATELETISMDWLGKLLGLPTSFLSVGSGGKGGGVIQGTASEAVVVALLAGRCRTLKGCSPDDHIRLVAYTSDQAHSCVKKACMIAGISHCRLLPTTAEDDWALNPATLSAAIEEDLAAGLLPFFLSATVGTTSSCAVDPVRALGEITQQHGLWMHVDAAYAGVAAVLPEMRPHFDGLELADSFDTNPHKWLLVNFDCSALWVRDSEPLKAALSLTPEFLRAKSNTLDLKDWQLPLGRRFRALKLWFVMRSYGAEGLRAYIRHHLTLADQFVALVEADERFELTAPPRFALTCFAVKGATAEENAAVLEGINSSGKAFLIHTVLGGRFTMRMALGGAQTQARHVRAAWAIICEETAKMLAKRSPKIEAQ